MRATPRDLVVFSLFVSLAGVVAFALAVIMRADGAARPVEADMLNGIGMLAWLYAAILALETASRRALLHCGIAAICIAPLAVMVLA